VLEKEARKPLRAPLIAVVSARVRPDTKVPAIEQILAAGALALRASAALIARAEVLVTNDSAPLHLATATGTRIVAIFGPTVPAFGFGPRGPLDRVVEHPGLDCRPCSPHGPQACPLGHHRCMREVGVEVVLQAVGSRIKGRGSSERGG